MEILPSAVIGLMQQTSAPMQSPKIDELAAARFAQLMQAAPVADATVAAAGANAVAPTPVNGAATTWGDRILSGMQGVSSDFHGQWDSVRQALASPRPLESREMLSLQLQMNQMSIQSELVGKLISRSTQNIDQLVRLQ